MTALLDSAALDQAGDTGTTLARLVRAEFMKIRTTDTGWLYLTGFIVFTALALTGNGFGNHSQLYPEQGLVSPAQAAAQEAHFRNRRQHDDLGAALRRHIRAAPRRADRDE
jgi:cytochrome c-type biogenesis protein CcmH/NrfG